MQATYRCLVVRSPIAWIAQTTTPPRTAAVKLPTWLLRRAADDRGSAEEGSTAVSRALVLADFAESERLPVAGAYTLPVVTQTN